MSSWIWSIRLWHLCCSMRIRTAVIFIKISDEKLFPQFAAPHALIYQDSHCSLVDLHASLLHRFRSGGQTTRECLWGCAKRWRGSRISCIRVLDTWFVYTIPQLRTSSIMWGKCHEWRLRLCISWNILIRAVYKEDKLRLECTVTQQHLLRFSRLALYLLTLIHQKSIAVYAHEKHVWVSQHSVEMLFGECW